MFFVVLHILSGKVSTLYDTDQESKVDSRQTGISSFSLCLLFGNVHSAFDTGNFLDPVLLHSYSWHPLLMVFCLFTRFARLFTCSFAFSMNVFMFHCLGLVGCHWSCRCFNFCVVEFCFTLSYYLHLVYRKLNSVTNESDALLHFAVPAAALKVVCVLIERLILCYGVRIWLWWIWFPFFQCNFLHYWKFQQRDCWYLLIVM